MLGDILSSIDWWHIITFILAPIFAIVGGKGYKLLNNKVDDIENKIVRAAVKTAVYYMSELLGKGKGLGAEKHIGAVEYVYDYLENNHQGLYKKFIKRKKEIDAMIREFIKGIKLERELSGNVESSVTTA